MEPQVFEVMPFASGRRRPRLRQAADGTADWIEAIGRGERIRTSDLSVPNRAHYQAVLRPEG